MSQPTTSNFEFLHTGETGAPLRASRNATERYSPDASTTTASLETLQQQLELLSLTAGSQEKITQSFAQLTCQLTSAIWCGQFRSQTEQPLNCVSEHNGIANQNLGLVKSSLLPTAEATIASAKAQVAKSGELTVVATPIFDSRIGPGQTRECLCLALNLGSSSPEPFLVILQMVAAYIGRWYEREMMKRLNWQVDATAAIAELMAEIASQEKKNDATILAANRLATFLGAKSVAIGYCVKRESKRTRVAAISGSSEFDASGSTAKPIRAALDETLVRDSVTVLPAGDDDERTMKLAHRKLLEDDAGSTLVSAPLTTKAGDTIGAWLCLLPANEQHHLRTVQFAKAVSSYLAEALHGNDRATAGPGRRLLDNSRRFAKGRVGRIALLVCLAIGIVMAIPVPHRVDCACKLVPITRRFAAAPHNGILMESFVKPGDLVTAGQVVARMDDRELNLELADLVAQRETTLKKRDVNRSSRDAAATKISEFEIQQLNAKVKLVEFRLANLEIKSEIDGIVLQGDLDDARGAPIRTGDVLMEFAPLDKLKLEVDVPASLVGYVQPGQSATIVLDGNPFGTVTGQVDSIHPESEVRDNENVFVSEVRIDNDNQRLRPGMNGRENKRGIPTDRMDSFSSAM